MEPVDELEGERDQQGGKQQNKGDVGVDSDAARSDVGIDAVGYEQQDGRNDPSKDNAGDGIDGAAKIRSLAGRGLNRSR